VIYWAKGMFIIVNYDKYMLTKNGAQIYILFLSLDSTNDAFVILRLVIK